MMDAMNFVSSNLYVEMESSNLEKNVMIIML